MTKASMRLIDIFSAEPLITSYQLIALSEDTFIDHGTLRQLKDYEELTCSCIFVGKAP
jgi:hypothetical protein